MFVLSLDGRLGLVDGLVLLGAGATYTCLLLRVSSRDADCEPAAEPGGRQAPAAA
ncbi:MAG: hypothetical protein ABWZ91_01540 [Nocardioides sp.]|jgi:hypothetical protein